MKTIQRTALLRIANLVRPALATVDYVPAFTHIKFDDGMATAYNDIIAISVPGEIGVARCIPGELLTKMLNSFGGEEVAMTYDAEKHTMRVSSGRSNMKLPTLGVAEFPFDIPNDEGPTITLTKAIMRGIEQCLLSVSADVKSPAAMGVTLEEDHGFAMLYSTDNVTISRYATDSAIKLPAGVPVILPTLFCEQLLSLVKAYPGKEPVLVLLPGALVAEVGEAVLFHKMLVDSDPLEFDKVIRRNCDPDAIMDVVVPIPDHLDAAINRALLTQAYEVSKKTTFDVSAKSIKLRTSSALADSDDEIDYKHGAAMKFDVDPALVARGLKACSHMHIHEKALMLSDNVGLLHIISHRS